MCVEGIAYPPEHLYSTVFFPLEFVLFNYYCIVLCHLLFLFLIIVVVALSVLLILTSDYFFGTFKDLCSILKKS